MILDMGLGKEDKSLSVFLEVSRIGRLVVKFQPPSMSRLERRADVLQLRRSHTFIFRRLGDDLQTNKSAHVLEACQLQGGSIR
jgi:hypothetical protein